MPVSASSSTKLSCSRTALNRWIGTDNRWNKNLPSRIYPDCSAIRRRRSPRNLVAESFIIIIIIILSLSKYDPETRGRLKIKEIQRWVRSFSQCSHRLVNYHEAVWHWNTARAPNIFASLYSQRSFYPDQTGAWQADVFKTPKSQQRWPSRAAYFSSLREAASAAAAPDSVWISQWASYYDVPVGL